MAHNTYKRKTTKKTVKRKRKGQKPLFFKDRKFHLAAGFFPDGFSNIPVHFVCGVPIYWKRGPKLDWKCTIELGKPESHWAGGKELAGVTRGC